MFLENNYIIKMIVEGSCGTKNCNDAENLVLTSLEWILFLN